MSKPVQKLIALTLAASMAFSSPAYAGMEQVMEGAFNAEINVTQPGAYMGARRGVVSFGKVRTANKISNVTLMTYTPAGFKAGCGGIDAWGGSFSFISQAQLEALGRDIASNATGYFFELALSNFPDGNAAIKSIRSLLQAANGKTINSCETAQKLVNGLFPDLEHARSVAANTSANKGTSNDAHAGYYGGDALSRVNYNDLTSTEAYRPNPIWSALTEAGVASWFPVGGDASFTETMMSFVGAVILKKGGEQDRDAHERLTVNFVPPVITIDDLVKGGTVKHLRCAAGANLCDTVNITTDTTITGLNDRIYTALIGTSTTPGIIDKFYTGDTAFTAGEQKLIGSLAPNVGGILRQLSGNPGAAKQFAKDATSIIAYNTACDMATEILSNLRNAMAGKSWTGVGEALKKINEARVDQMNQCEAGRKGASDLANLMQIHQLLSENVKKGQ